MSRSCRSSWRFGWDAVRRCTDRTWNLCCLFLTARDSPGVAAVGAAALNGAFAEGGIVTPSNAQMCGNRSRWWGFVGVKNVDGTIRDLAGAGLAAECDQLSTVGPDAARLLTGSARATGAHSLAVECVIHALGPTSYFIPESERTLRRTYSECLRLADERSLQCLALPALCCGVAGFPAAASARAAFDAIEQADFGSLRRIEFMLLDERAYAAFADAAHARWGTGRGEH